MMTNVNEDLQLGHKCSVLTVSCTLCRSKTIQVRSITDRKVLLPSTFSTIIFPAHLVRSLVLLCFWTKFAKGSILDQRDKQYCQIPFFSPQSFWTTCTLPFESSSQPTQLTRARSCATSHTVQSETCQLSHPPLSQQRVGYSPWMQETLFCCPSFSKLLPILEHVWSLQKATQSGCIQQMLASLSY